MYENSNMKWIKTFNESASTNEMSENEIDLLNWIHDIFTPYGDSLGIKEIDEPSLYDKIEDRQDYAYYYITPIFLKGKLQYFTFNISYNVDSNSKTEFISRIKEFISRIKKSNQDIKINDKYTDSKMIDGLSSIWIFIHPKN